MNDPTRIRIKADWRPALLAAVVAASALGFGPCKSDEDKVEDTVKDFASAIVDENYGEACDLLTEDAQDSLAEAAEENDRDDESCEGELERDLTDEEREVFEDIEVSNVEIDGDRATADVKSDEGEEETKLKKEDGDWKLEVE
jgi:hypothetical protein